METIKRAKHPQNGVTLLELLVVTCLIAATLSIGLPALAGFRERIQARQSAGQLHQLISQARSQSVHLTRRVTLCPLDSSNRCMRDWNQTLTVFTDANNNRALDSGEQILQQIPEVSTNDELRAFNGRVISFDPMGFAGFNNGTISYCIKGQTNTGSAYIISRNGRVRMAEDQNNDGLPELPNGNNISCPNG